ncbi:MAG: interleukin-like EMT inducer domain-containing protein, partial [bacterium]|nr:interleukin-like EMT inducer domain-containing protein [bacterium]
YGPRVTIDNQLISAKFFNPFWLNIARLQPNVTIDNQLISAKLYRNKQYLPNAYIVHRARVCKNLRTTLQYLSDPNHDPKTTVILNESFGTMVEKQENLIGKTKIRAPRPITVFSSPQTASIRIDGNEICDNLPGYNVAIINPATRDLDDITAFSQELSISTTTTEPSQFSTYLNSIPDGKIVVLAWKGDTAPQITDEIMTMFQSLGGTPENILGNTFAFIGVKGANPGEAMQSTRTPGSEISVPYPLVLLYRFDEEKPILPEPENAADTTAIQPNSIKIIKSQVALVKYSPNKIIYNAILFRPGFMVLSELYYPGWQAFIDGKPTRILKVNGIFRSVFLNPGNHQVEFRYTPSSLWYGSLISSITLLGMIIIGVVRLNRKRKIAPLSSL